MSLKISEIRELSASVKNSPWKAVEPAEMPWSVISVSGVQLAKMSAAPGPHNGDNARLMAAAPDLAATVMTAEKMAEALMLLRDEVKMRQGLPRYEASRAADDALAAYREHVSPD